jgi:hypothetical protein
MEAKPKQYLTKADVALRYANCTTRTIDRRVKAKELPPPAFYQGRFPLWDEAALDAHDEARSKDVANREAAAAERTAAAKKASDAARAAAAEAATS